jgi:hypothetical protein
MYLAAILGLCAWIASPAVSQGVPRHFLQQSQETQPPTDATPSAPAQDSPQQDSPQNTAPSQPPVAPTPEAPAPAQTAPESEKKSESEKPPTKAASKKRRRTKKSTVATSSNAAPEKKVVRNGGTADPVVQLAPGVSPEQASNQRQNTTQLLAATDANLKQISSGPLNSTQQDSVGQIRKYMEQAKAAEQSGDVQRAQNLASKALLLSDDLAKH